MTPPSESPAGPPLLPPAGEAWFPVRDGFPRPDWKRIGDWLDAARLDKPREQLVTELVREWLSRVQATLGEPYAVHESANFILLTHQDFSAAGRLLELLESSFNRVDAVLGDLFRPDLPEKLPILVFDSEDRYYTYISYFYHEKGEFAGSGGVCLLKGHMHVAFPSRGVQQFGAVTHELLHVCVSHLPLPTWVKEGLAEVMGYREDVQAVRDVMGYMDERRWFSPMVEDKAEHLLYWDSQRIQEFWIGKSYHTPTGNILSYGLSQAIVQGMMADPGKFHSFLATANRRDAGEEAALTCFGVSLAGPVTALLGPGDWTPHPEQWPKDALKAKE